MSDAALFQELNTLRENSRVMLQKSWQRVEELERQSNDLDTEIEELERQLQTLKQQASKFHQSMGSNTNSMHSRGAWSRHMSMSGRGSSHYGGSVYDSSFYTMENGDDSLRDDSLAYGDSRYMDPMMRSSTSARRAISMKHAGFTETQADRIAHEVQTRRQSVGGGILSSHMLPMDDSSYSTRKGSVASSTMIDGSMGGTSRMKRRSTIGGFGSSHNARAAVQAMDGGVHEDGSFHQQEDSVRHGRRQSLSVVPAPQPPSPQDHQMHMDESAADLAMSIFKMNSRPSPEPVPLPAQEEQIPPKKKEMTEMGRRLQVMEQARDLKVDDLRHRINFEEEMATGLRDDVEEQQEEIQQLQEELEEIDAPNQIVAMESKVRDQAMEILELEAQLEEFQSQTTYQQKYHIALEERWEEWDDRLAEAEADSTQVLQRWNHRKEFYEQDQTEKQTKLFFLKDSVEEAVSCLRDDLSEVMPVEEAISMVKELERLQDSLTEKEESVTGLLIQRVIEKQNLIERLDKAQSLQSQISKQLGDMARLGLELDSIAERESSTSRATNANGLSSLYDQVGRTIRQLQGALEDRTDGLTSAYGSPQTSDLQALKAEERRLREAIRSEMLHLMDRLPMNDSNSSHCGLSVEEAKAKEELDRLEREVIDKESKASQLEKELDIVESAVTTTNHSTLHKTQQDLENEERFLGRGLRQKDEMTEKLESLLRGQEELVNLLNEEIGDMRDHGEITEEEYNELK